MDSQAKKLRKKEKKIIHMVLKKIEGKKKGKKGELSEYRTK